MKNDADPLQLPAARGARLVALDRLDDAGTEADRLSSDPDDLDALHDLRVALRRMRSWLRAFKPELKGGASAKDRHRLRDLVDATNRGRDADVQLAWLAKTAQHGDATRKRGVERLTDLIKIERRAAGAPFNGSSLQNFARERGRLAKRLGTVKEPVRAPSSPPPSLAAAIAGRLPEHLEALYEALDAIHRTDDEREAHVARIAAKRLRYLLEPAESVRGCKSLLAQLKKLQDDLGELHDAHVLGHRIREAIVNHPGPSEDELQAVAAALAAERDTIFHRIERRWLNDAAAVEAFSRSIGLFEERLGRIGAKPAR